MNFRQMIEELRRLDTRNPGAWPRWVHLSAAVLAAAAIVALGAKVFIQPKYEELNRQKRTEAELRTTFEAKQQKVAALDAYKAQLEQMQHSFGDMLKQLPSKSEVANLLNDISQTRIASSLEEELFQPQPEVPKEFYAEIPNRIVVTGTYHQMGAFVSGVAALPRIVTIDEVEIVPVPGVAKDQLRMSALAKTYRYLTEGAPAPATPGGAAK
ncbi:MAG: type 4a pilus biogenesis protein PilO [Nevskia sp.]|nr:type 4a pilus biogenesis protein PilO [Nevskia sp.]